MPYHSLSWAHTWLGRDSGAVVDVTQVPQSVYFSEDSIRAFQATRGDGVDSQRLHHAEYKLHGRSQPMCSPSKDDGVGSVATNSVTLAASGFLEGFFKSSTLDQITFFERKHVHASGATHMVHTFSLECLLATEALTLVLLLTDWRVGDRRRQTPRDPGRPGVLARAPHRAAQPVRRQNRSIGQGECDGAMCFRSPPLLTLSYVVVDLATSDDRR